MRYIVTHEGEAVGHVELRGYGEVPGAVAGRLEPTDAYAKIRDVCRRSVDGMIAAEGGIRAITARREDPESKADSVSDDGLAALLAGVLAVAALPLALTDLAGRPVSTTGPVTIQDYTGSATEYLGQVSGGAAIMVGAILADPGAESAAVGT